MRSITQEGLNLIKHFEGFSETLYICPAGYPTIGYGHMVKNYEKFPEVITKEAAEKLLKQDLKIAEHAVLRLIAVPLSDMQFNALVSFTFNLGAGALQRSTLRLKVNREEHDEVPNQLQRWIWAGNRKLNGLIKRRKAESLMYSGY
ncbi:lysozyme [endosymbiont of Acanthamoeba sp. UWC8]|uniref:lysozyme n=1 Tax=endosymbiont of Acanthamoeba sp. UWC8 TaxID=86106 RepID=UPI0004D1F45F|nr:lysozyme [endosymbiont of Acanthamoeba sp. UWC8]AIF81405.1 lysozyme [endosymbiont of Acanthamoeba sp. UWC8]